MLWDKGTYSPDGDLSPEQQLAKGEIKWFSKARNCVVGLY